MGASCFFETAIPFCIARQQLAFLCSQGTIHFTIEGEGSWTLELGNLRRPVSRGLSGRADLAVWYSKKAFASFLDGTMDPRAAIRAGEFTASGDVHLLARLAQLMITPRKSASQTAATNALN